MSDKHTIVYKIKSETYEDFSWKFELQHQSHRCTVTPNSTNNEWQKLENQQCSHCPYSSKTNEFCLVAQNMGSISEYFKGISSIEIFDLEVVIDDVVHFQSQSSAQRISSALTGLAISGSGCEHTQFLWPMLQQHSPMASLDDSVLRALSNMAINYVLNPPEEDFLEFCTTHYQRMHILNKDYSKRMSAISTQDSLNNGLINLDMFIKVILYNLNNKFEDFIDIYTQR